MKSFKLITAVLTAVIFCSCARIQIEGDCNKSRQSNREVVQASLYGFNWDDDSRQIRKTYDGLGLAAVEYNVNGVDLLLSCLSLGFYVPVKIEYWLEADEKRTNKKNPGGNK